MLLEVQLEKDTWRLSSGLCWKDYASHLAWEHLWIPRRSWNTLQGRARPRCPSEPGPTRNEDEGRVNNPTVSTSDREM